MKELLIMRHAKSSWDAGHRTDFERPLNKRGRRAAPVMGAFLADNDMLPDLIVSSPAERAAQTTGLVVESAGYEGEVRFDEHIYAAYADDLMDVVRGLPEDRRRVMLVGHNPGFEDLVKSLCGGAVRMPTAAIAYLDLFVGQWQEVKAGSGILQWLVRPKILK